MQFIDAVFQRLNDIVWGPAMLVLILCALLAVLLTMPKLDWEESINRRLEQEGRDLSAEQQEAF